jgi:hypothetical protein
LDGCRGGGGSPGGDKNGMIGIRLKVTCLAGTKSGVEDEALCRLMDIVAWILLVEMPMACLSNIER